VYFLVKNFYKNDKISFNLSDVKAEVSKLLDNQLKENQVYKKKYLNLTHRAVLRDIF